MYIAVDIGGTKTLCAAFSDEGEILRREKNPTNPDFQQFIPELIQHIEAIAGNDAVRAIALAVPAVIDYDTNIAKRFGNLDWEDVDFVTPLQQHFAVPVNIENDANLGALGEANMGAGTNFEKMLYVTLSTGIGTGVTVNGKISPALRESEGGMMHFEHDGKLMEWEDFASGKAFKEEFGKYGAEDENPEDWKAWSEDVSVGLVALISIIQPDVVVIGGSMGNFIDKYEAFLLAAIKEKHSVTVDHPIITAADDPDNAVINGCYVLCKQQEQA